LCKKLIIQTKKFVESVEKWSESLSVNKQAVNNSVGNVENEGGFMRRYVLSTILFLVLAQCIAFPANAGLPPKRVIVIVANGISLEDIQQMRELKDGAWIDNSSIAAMNLRTAGSMNDVNNMVTLGSGTRAVAGDKAVEAYRGSDEVNDLQVTDWIHQLTGRKGNDHAIYIPSYQWIASANQHLPYSVTPGLLGKTLHEHSLTTAAIGNSDKGSKSIVRFAPLLVMDETGTVDQGNVGKVTVQADSDHVYGIKTNYDYLYRYIQADASSAIISVDLGDFYRLYSMRRSMDAKQFDQMKLHVLQEYNQFMTQLFSNQRSGDLISFVSPMVNDEAEARKSQMGPILLHTVDHPMGTLTSTTTRQPGIVGNMDLAPTILSWLGIPAPSSVMGKEIVSLKGNQAFWSDWERIKHIYSTRGKVLYGYVTFQIAILIFSAALWFFAAPQKRMYQRANQLIRFLLLILTLSPFLFLILPVFPTLYGVKMTILFLLLLGSAIAMALIRLPFSWIFFIISLLNWMPILLDGVFARSFLMKQSYLGYDPVIGARYYGIGNEYMGVVIGSSILSLAMLLELIEKEVKLIKGVSVAIFGLYLFFFAMPEWGTNAGGAITAIAAYFTSFFRLFDIELNRRYLFWGIVSVLISSVTLFYVNLAVDDQMQSHIGRAMEKLLQGDIHEIWNITRRKMQMNWHLVQVSSWSKVFITSLLILGMLCYRPTGMIARLSLKYPYAVRGFFGIIIGAFTALVVNDSGIVAAATTIIFMVVPLLYLGLEEKMG
jgi:hypothetical protein